MKVIFDYRPKNVIAIGMDMVARRVGDQMARLIVEKKHFVISEGIKEISVNGTWFVRAENQTELD